MDWAARAIGAFYIVAGLGGLWQVVLAWRLTHGRPTPARRAERVADGVLALGAVLVLVSGVSLMMLHISALPAFLAAWTLQAFYLLAAQTWLKPRDAIGWRGRRDAVHAFAAYTAATALVICLPSLDLLD